MALPSPHFFASNIAIFLDVDGTLLEIAPTPAAVLVPVGLPALLQLVAGSENGALALISGRPVMDLDRLFAPHKFSVAGQHGLERRDERGILHRPHLDPALLDPARQMLRKLVQDHDGLLLEDKGFSLAVHYRLAPAAENAVRVTMDNLCHQLNNRYLLRPGKCVLELAPAGVSKRTAIEAFMQEAPFRGRVPVFFGDDVTDEDGFMAVNELGGHSFRVGPAVSTAAKYRIGSVTDVIAWLHERNEHPALHGDQ